MPPTPETRYRTLVGDLSGKACHSIFIVVKIAQGDRYLVHKAIHGPSASWRDVSPDVWAQRVPEQAGALEVPVVDLLAIGIDADEFGELSSLVPGLEHVDCG